MNILEQILEKIEHEAMTNKEIGRKQCEGMARAMNIIRSYIDDVTGEDIHSKCSECSRRKWYQKGYEDGKKDICNDNDWIPVEERLPKRFTVVLASFDNGDVETLWQCWGEDEEELKYFELGDEERDGGIKKVIAWQPLPEPYKPKKK